MQDLSKIPAIFGETLRFQPQKHCSQLKMKDQNKVSTVKIILMGELIVNLPVTIIIILTVIIFTQVGLGLALACIVGSGVGWFFWDKLLDKWKRWALNQNIDRERLFRLGKLGLINFYRYRIIDEESEN